MSRDASSSHSAGIRSTSARAWVPQLLRSTWASGMIAPRPMPQRVNYTKAEPPSPQAALVARGRRCALAFCALLATSAGTLFVADPAEARTSTGDVSVPIVTTQASDGSWLATVEVSVAGGPMVPVQLDTGSSGLVIDSTAVGKGARTTSQSYSSGYISGTVNGQIETGTVSIGGLKSASSTAFSVVSPSSSAGRTWSNGPIRGILGIAMTDDTSPTAVYSPLLQLPSPYWQGVTVKVAKGQNATGSLTIGPVRDNRHALTLPMYPATPSTYPNGRPAFQKDTTMCWQIGHIPSSCGLTDMDLGDPSPGLSTRTSAAFTTGTPSIRGRRSASRRRLARRSGASGLDRMSRFRISSGWSRCRPTTPSSTRASDSSSLTRSPTT